MKKCRLKLNSILETERCIIKIPDESEAEYIWNMITHDTTKYMIWEKGDTYNSTLENIKKSIDNSKKGTTWDAAIYDKKSGLCIGRCGINRIDEEIPAFELGYWINEKLYGKGLIPECVNRYLKYAFEESNFEKVIIRCDSKNVNSSKVAIKCGLNLEGTFKNHERIKGELRDTEFYGITREEYKKARL